VKLTAKQRAFVDAYIECRNATEAAKRAGYSERSARQVGANNMSKVYIREALAARLEEIETTKVASMKEVMEFFSSVMRGKETEQVVTAKGDVIERSPVVFDRITAGKELAKLYSKCPAKDIEEQDLRIKKLRAELNSMNAEEKHGGITIIDDIGDDDDGEETD